MSHPQVLHPNEFITTSENAINKANDWLASHLAILFGLVWTIWVFISVPLIALILPADLQSKIFYLASGWIQLWALPLFVYVGNKLQKTSDAQSDAMTKALTHIAIVEDQNQQLINEVKGLIDQNTELTTQIHNLVSTTKPTTRKQTDASKSGSS